MGTVKKQWWLFLLPLLAPLLVTISHRVQSNTTLYEEGGGFAADSVAERSALGTLSYYLGKETSPNAISVRYFVTRPGGPHKGTSIYRLEYNRRNRTLTKSALVPPLKSRQDLPQLWVWSDVSEDAVHRVAAPVRALRFTKQVEAHQGGNLSELAKHGAQLSQKP